MGVENEKHTPQLKENMILAKKTKKLRELLDTEELIVAPGAYDALSAKIIERTGFLAVYVGVNLRKEGFPREKC